MQAEGVPCKILGQKQYKVQIDTDWSTDATLIVSPHLLQPCILGMDILSRYPGTVQLMQQLRMAMATASRTIVKKHRPDIHEAWSAKINNIEISQSDHCYSRKINPIMAIQPSPSSNNCDTRHQHSTTDNNNNATLKQVLTIQQAQQQIKDMLQDISIEHVRDLKTTMTATEHVIRLRENVIPKPEKMNHAP